MTSLSFVDGEMIILKNEVIYSRMMYIHITLLSVGIVGDLTLRLWRLVERIVWNDSNISKCQVNQVGMRQPCSRFVAKMSAHQMKTQLNSFRILFSPRLQYLCICEWLVLEDWHFGNLVYGSCSGAQIYESIQILVTWVDVTPKGKTLVSLFFKPFQVGEVCKFDQVDAFISFDSRKVFQQVWVYLGPVGNCDKIAIAADSVVSTHNTSWGCSFGRIEECSPQNLILYERLPLLHYFQMFKHDNLRKLWFQFQWLFERHFRLLRWFITLCTSRECPLSHCQSYCKLLYRFSKWWRFDTHSI